MFKNLLNFIKYNRLSLNLIHRFCLMNMANNFSLVNEVKRESEVVISLSAEENNFSDLEITLYSLLNQIIKPDRVILWLDKNLELSELPYSITSFVKRGLDIKFIDYKGDYTSIIYALKNFPDSIVVKASPNIFYPKDWLKKLYHSYISSPKDIHVHRAEITEFKDSNYISYNYWKKYAEQPTAAFYHYPVSDCGILFPPRCFVSDFYREDIYNKKVNAKPDIWLMFMAIVSNRKIRLVKNHIKVFSYINWWKQLYSDYTNYKNYSNINEQVLSLMDFYGQNIRQKLKKN